MNSTKKVSVITPCYNGEQFIHRLLDSILKQDYPCIEMCVIDDGSTDGSAKIIKSYITRFSEKGYQLTYIYQQNSGQSVAINKGLQWMMGDYLVWPDSDDFYSVDTAISELVQVLETSDEETSIVRCHCHLLDEKTLKRVGEFAVTTQNDGKTDLFEDCLFAKNDFWFVPGNYMAKSAHLREVLPSLTIYTEKNAGQNWQLMLPLFYNRKCLTLKRYLYFVLVRSNSHSRGQYATYEKVIAKYEAYERTIINTLLAIHMCPTKRKDYLKEIDRKYKKITLQVMINYGKLSDAGFIFKYLNQECQPLDFALRIKYYLLYIPALNKLLKIVFSLIRK